LKRRLAGHVLPCPRQILDGVTLAEANQLLDGEPRFKDLDRLVGVLAPTVVSRMIDPLDPLLAKRRDRTTDVRDRFLQIERRSLERRLGEEVAVREMCLPSSTPHCSQ
jgi:hypothetical protein